MGQLAQIEEVEERLMVAEHHVWSLDVVHEPVVDLDAPQASVPQAGDEEQHLVDRRVRGAFGALEIEVLDEDPDDDE